MTISRSSRLSLAAAGVILALGLTGCDTMMAVYPDSGASVAPAEAGTALALLEEIPVKGRAPKTGYSRDEFGPAWADVDRNGCDTRNDILNRDLTEVVHTNSVPCKVESGVLDDPYTGTVIHFQRGQDTSAAVQIEHSVALSDAWQKGAQQLTAERRLQFANDPLNLLAVDGPANMAKGDSDAATWLPPNKEFRCEYVAQQTAVKAKYELWMTAAEHTAIHSILSGCTGQSAPGAEIAPPTTSPVEQAAPEPSPAGDVSYASCAEVKAAGAAPIHAGQPGFSPKFDGNGDGVGCES